jgi:uncharacterized membrane protein YkvA (DUF1232 family)
MATLHTASTTVEARPEVPPIVDPPAAQTFRERLAQRWGSIQLSRLFEKRFDVLAELRRIPNRMQKVTNQARLALDLAEDFRAGTYRDVSWLSIALAAGALVYAVSPGDVVPDVIPALGSLDDMVVLAVVMRFLEKDLRAYARFKGYVEQDYF